MRALLAVIQPPFHPVLADQTWGRRRRQLACCVTSPGPDTPLCLKLSRSNIWLAQVVAIKTGKRTVYEGMRVNVSDLVIGASRGKRLRSGAGAGCLEVASAAPGQLTGWTTELCCLIRPTRSARTTRGPRRPCRRNSTSTTCVP